MVIVVGWALQATAMVTMPLVFAFFLAALLHPVLEGLQGVLPRRVKWLALALTMSVALLVLVCFLGALWFAVNTVSGELPTYTEILSGYLNDIRQWAWQNQLPVPEPKDGVASGMAIAATMFFQVAWDFFVGVVLVFFYTLLMLAEAGRWGAKIDAAGGKQEGETWREVALTISLRVRQYLLVRIAIGGMTALIVGAWLWFSGVDLVYVWILLEFLLDFVPSLGSLVAGALIGFFAVMQLGLVDGLVVLAGVVLIEQIMGNYVDPRWQGKTVDISPLVMLVAVVFWGFIWGVPGALLAVPLTATLVIVSAHLPAMWPIAVLFSGNANEPEIERRTRTPKK